MDVLEFESARTTATAPDAPDEATLQRFSRALARIYERHKFVVETLAQVRTLPLFLCCCSCCLCCACVVLLPPIQCDRRESGRPLCTVWSVDLPAR